MTAAARRPTPSLPEKLDTVHIIGICGTAMAALAGMFKDVGIRVTGSDAMAYPPVSTLLAEMGINILKGYRAENVDQGSALPDLVVVGNVCRPDNPEAVRTLELGVPYASLPEVLRLVFMKGRRTVVPTGTHGKTTSSSLVAWLLQHAGRDPSYMIGGIPVNFGTNYRIGQGDTFVVEGDEYDTAYFDKVPKFWHYPASVATINNIEFDHADIYANIDEIQHVFDRFAASVATNGVLWVNGDDPRAVSAGGAAKAPVKTFGLGPDNHLHPVEVEFVEAGTRLSLTLGGRALGQIESPLWGEHNVRNTLGAIGLALSVGVEFSQIVSGLAGFRGVMKRQEVKGEIDGVLVIDDFAHHPSAVRETVRGLRARYPKRTIWVAFEAKSNTSRRAIFQDAYPPAFAAADHVILSEVWKKDNLAEDQKISIPQLAADIGRYTKTVERIPQVDDIVAYLAERARPGDVVIGLSGSDFSGFHNKLLAALRARAGVAAGP